MSQLTVDVIGNATLPANIKLQSLTVSNTANVGSFFLAQGDNGLVVADTEEYYATLVNDVTDIQNTTISRSLLLFPGTEDVTEVAITLVDQNNGHVFTGEYMVSFFQGDSLDPITLQRAKNTVLRLEVNITDVDNPNETIELTGRITDWTYGGQFGIGIN